MTIRERVQRASWAQWALVGWLTVAADSARELRAVQCRFAIAEATAAHAQEQGRPGAGWRSVWQSLLGRRGVFGIRARSHCWPEAVGWPAERCLMRCSSSGGRRASASSRSVGGSRPDRPAAILHKQPRPTAIPHPAIAPPANQRAGAPSPGPVLGPPSTPSSPARRQCAASTPQHAQARLDDLAHPPAQPAQPV